MARLIKTEKEVEGRYEETWDVVEEDALDQWPAGPGEVVGRPAAKVDGYEKARGEARYTADVRLPGMLDAALLRSPHAHAQAEADRRLARWRRRACAACSAGRGRVARRTRRSTRGSPLRRSRPRRPAQARAALELIDVEWEELEPLLDADEAVRRGSLVGESRRYERGDYERGLAEADVVVEAEYRTQTLNHNPLETHQCVCEWRGDGLDVYVSTQYIWGVRDEVAQALDLAADKVRVVCEFMGGGFGAKARRGDYTLLAAELARRTGRPVRYAVTRRDENIVGGNRNATRQRVTAAHGRTARSPRSAASTPARSAGAAGCRPPPARCSCSTPARTCARSSTARS